MSQHLTKAAGIIIDKMKTPGAFLEFLTESLGWVHQYELKNPNHKDSSDPHFSLCRLIHLVAIPWYNSGGEKEISKGLAELYDFMGCDSFEQEVISIMMALAYDLHYVGRPQTEYLRSYIIGIETLYEIAFCFKEHENSKEIITQNAA